MEMTAMNRHTLRRAFQRPSYFPVKVTPSGFEVDGLDEYEKLRGRILKMTLIRKLFDDGSIVCSSPDGTTAENGTLCESCQHPRCQPRLRIHLGRDELVYVLDLAPSSARNLFATEDRAESEGDRLEDWILELSVIEHDSWGEVVFERVDSPHVPTTPSVGSSRPGGSPPA